MHVKLGCVFFLVLATTACSEQQGRIFEADSISYTRGWQQETQEGCLELSEELSTYLNNGWKVVASSPKEKVVADGKGKCIGTEYVLTK